MNLSHLSPGELLIESMPTAHQTLPEPNAVVAVAVVVSVLHLPVVVLLRELVHVQRVSGAIWTSQQRRRRQLMP